MSELAGYDVIGEIHRDTVIDTLDLSPIVNPVDGKSIYLFGGPFSTDFDLDLGALGSARCRFLVAMELAPDVHQSTTRIIATLSGGSVTYAGLTLNHLGGSATVTISLRSDVASKAPGADPTLFVPVFVLSASSVVVAFDDPTRQSLDGAFGAGSADRFATALSAALSSLVGASGDKRLPVMAFTVRPGVDSTSPTQLSAAPTVAWIDPSTLGVFGYYRAAAWGGDVSRKTAGDLAGPGPEYFYNQPGLFSVLEGRRVALLISADAFQRVIACPAVRNKVVRTLTARAEKSLWVGYIRDQNGTQIREDASKQLVAYYMDELSKDPKADPQILLDRAKARIDRDVEAAIGAQADAAESAWLDSNGGAGPETGAGQQVITDRTPPPCGTGAVQLDRRSVDHAQSDLVPMLRRFGIRLAAGKIVADYFVNGELEVITGDIDFDITGDVDLHVEVDQLGRIGGGFVAHAPTVNITATGLTGTVLALLQDIASDTWDSILTFVSLLIQSALQKALNQVEFPHTLQIDLSDIPFATRPAEIRIEPDSLTLLGLVGRIYRYNDFAPGLFIDTALEDRHPADLPTIVGPIVLKPTAWGCPGATFDYTRTFWEETFSVKARLRDAPLPITISGWSIQLGNFSWNSIAGSRFLDPRITPSHNPEPIAAGAIRLTGNVERLDNLDIGTLHGDLTAETITVDVAGDPDHGWDVTAHGRDGNFYLLFAVDAQDGDGKAWHAEMFVHHAGDRVELPAAFYAYQEDCSRKFGAWFRNVVDSMAPKVGIAKVHPGDTVKDRVSRGVLVAQASVAGGNERSLDRIQAAARELGPGLLKELGRRRGTTLKIEKR